MPSAIGRGDGHRADAEAGEGEGCAPDHIGGFYTRIFEYPYVVINSEKPWPWQRAIAAHELGHALLHNDGHTFLATSNFVTRSKIEHEANLFAATLLIGDEKPEHDESIYDFARRMYVPIEFITSLPWNFFKDD
jgi:Zn-dependent peptidase ImmA (M78 family)